MNASTVLLLDPDPESLKSISFLLGIARFEVCSFADERECLNWLTIMRGNSGDILSILINSQMEKEKIHDFFHSLDDLGHVSPVLIVDRHKSVLKKDELLNGTSTKLPVFVCESSEMLVMLNHFKVLKTNLAATNKSFRMLFQH